MFRDLAVVPSLSCARAALNNTTQSWTRKLMQVTEKDGRKTVDARPLLTLICSLVPNTSLQQYN